MNQIISDILAEIERQNEKHGAQSMTNCGDNETRLLVLASEVGEVARAMLRKDDANLYEEAIQVAACCVAWSSVTYGIDRASIVRDAIQRVDINSYNEVENSRLCGKIIHTVSSGIYGVPDIAAYAIAIAKTVEPK